VCPGRHRPHRQRAWRLTKGSRDERSNIARGGRAALAEGGHPQRGMATIHEGAGHMRSGAASREPSDAIFSTSTGSLRTEAPPAEASVQKAFSPRNPHRRRPPDTPGLPWRPPLHDRPRGPPSRIPSRAGAPMQRAPRPDDSASLSRRCCFAGRGFPRSTASRRAASAIEAAPSLSGWFFRKTGRCNPDSGSGEGTFITTQSLR
jgi:hypothetical protein